MRYVNDLCRYAAGALVLAALLVPVTTFAQGISLVGQLPMPDPSVRNSDIWGWVNPNDGKEYVAIGKYPSVNSIVHIVDVSVPAAPVIVDTLSGVPAFDLKIWIDGNNVYLYLCDGNASGGNDSQVWDVSDPTNPALVGNFPTCHNIYSDSKGYMYLSYSTLRIYELNTEPDNPTFVWTDGLAGGHDVYVDEATNRLYDFHGYADTFIYNISTLPAAPESIGVLPDTAGIVYHHSGWTSADSRYLYVNDELGNALANDITVWNVSNPAMPYYVSAFHDANATPHNSIRVGGYLMESYYVAGFRVFDITGGNTLSLYDEYDTAPGYTGNGLYEGCWGVWVSDASGYIYTSDMQNGLFVFNFTAPTPTGVSEPLPPAFVLEQNFPNPFNPVTTISYSLDVGGAVRLAVYDAAGRRIRTLVNGVQAAGPQSVQWDGRDQAGHLAASGVYFYRLEAGGGTETRQMVLLK
jgi:choice-of-anchor B domain-containing protein